jgi:hypothetical protein
MSGPTFEAFARALFERKKLRRELRSAQSQQQWCSILEHHLLPAFGTTVVEDLRRARIEAWKDDVARRINAGEYSPVTANDWLKLLRQDVMDRTKTGRNQRLALPRELMEILRWRVAKLPRGPMRESDLLFPSARGGFRARTVLRKPFAAVARSIGLEKRITPRAMRRTFQDLARAAEVRDIVTRAVSGHATETMQRHYSTVSPLEMRDGLARVLSIAGFTLDASNNE